MKNEPVSVTSPPEARIAGLLSLVVPLAALLLMVFLVQPWGDYPIADDWIYARIARRFADTGKLIFDHDTGAAFIGQGLIAAPFIRLLGFSHTRLRFLTIAFSALLLYVLWQLLSYAGVRPRVRAFALLAVVWNPIFAAVSFSFLTEIYGYALALFGALLWLRGRRERELGPPPAAGPAPVVSWRAAILTGLVTGAGFWIRQYCVLAFPALLGATFISVWRTGGRRRLLASAWRLAASCLAFAFVVGSYFLFARHTAAVPMTDFSTRLHRAGSIRPEVPLLEAGIFLTYMTAFFFPTLLLFPFKQLGRRILPSGIALFVLGVATALLLLGVPPHVDLHPLFPFLGHFIYNAGVGPVNFTDVLILPLRPRWPSSVWVAIECVLLAANVLWAGVILLIRQSLRRRDGDLGTEVLWFGCLFVLGSLAVTALVDRLATYDRYYLPELFGLTLVTAVLLSPRFGGKESEDAAPRGSRSGRLSVRFAAAVIPMALFTTAGLHDYFRWNDARWALFRRALNQGVSPANIQGGYEVNGWTAYDLFLSKATPPGCIGPCSCAFGWYCLDDSYRIGMNVYGNYEVIASRQPDYWLAPGPPVTLSRRKTR